MNTHQNTFQNHPYNSNDEIDLMELCATLWRSRWLIFAFMVLCALPTAIWLKWQPSIYKLETLFDSTSAYDIQALQPTALPGGAQYEVNPLKREDFYQDLLTQAGSLNTQRLFWEQWSNQPLSLDPSSGSTKNDLEFKKFFTSLSLIPPNPKNPNVTLSQINLETSDPARDIKTLTAYVDFLNSHVVDKFVSQLEKGYASSIQKLEFDYNTLKKREQQRLEDTLLQLQESLTLARSLNIVDTPYEKLAGIELKVVDDRQYLLGTRVLSQEINSLEARTEKSLSAFVPELRNMEYWQEILANDINNLRTIKNDIQAFNLASPVVSSLEPIKPKKMLIFLGAIFFSIFVGAIFTLIAHGIKNYMAQSDKLS